MPFQISGIRRKALNRRPSGSLPLHFSVLKRTFGPNDFEKLKARPSHTVVPTGITVRNTEIGLTRSVILLFHLSTRSNKSMVVASATSKWWFRLEIYLDHVPSIGVPTTGLCVAQSL